MGILDRMSSFSSPFLNLDRIPHSHSHSDSDEPTFVLALPHFRPSLFPIEGMLNVECDSIWAWINGGGLRETCNYFIQITLLIIDRGECRRISTASSLISPCIYTYSMYSYIWDISITCSSLRVREWYISSSSQSWGQN